AAGAEADVPRADLRDPGADRLRRRAGPPDRRPERRSAREVHPGHGPRCSLRRALLHVDLGPAADHRARRGRHRRGREPQRHAEDNSDPIPRPRSGLRREGARGLHLHLRGRLRARSRRPRSRQHRLGLSPADLAVGDEGVGRPRARAADGQPRGLLLAACGHRGLRTAALDGDPEQRGLGRRVADVCAADAAARGAARDGEHPPVPAGHAVRGLARLPAHPRGLGAGDPGVLGLRSVHLHPRVRGVPRFSAARRREPVGAAARRYAPFAALAFVAALVRLPFLGSIGPDEGGYAYVAWRWSQGADLYRSVWIDRPQGLIVVYRLLISISHSAWAIRLGAVVAGATITLLIVAIGRLLASPEAGFLAGGLYAIAGIGPHIEGYTFNGELAASVPATAAVAAVLVARRRDSRRWLVAAGTFGGSAILMKQSGFDGLAVVL